MKTYKNLWDKFISVENFELAARRAVKSKKSKKSVQYFLEHKDELIQKLRTSLINGTFKTSQYKIFTIYEPKKREIYKLPLYPDHVLHHALINILGPIWQKMFIHDSYACIPGRGLHAASRRTMDFVRRNKYVLQCDIRKFYPSINHKKMIGIIARKIHDRRILKILKEIVFSVGGETNLPIGNLTSQWLGNVYLNELDYFVKHILHWRDYIRYCDDFCLYGNNKHQLKYMLSNVKRFIEINLFMSFSRTIVRETKNGVDFIGYRHFRKFVLLRKKSALKIKRRISNIIKYHDWSGHCVGQIAAAYGWLKWACTYNLRNKICQEKCGLFDLMII
ncbi:MAG: group II intron reverse transcriptase domain-containing protein [Alphaproteobacteria bacterium]|nr:group II intron reverse transcriptase domain-containing protein [Alphaproteobacteria bacterium]